ncbi:MAG: trimethylamine methyltransferase family protein [Deltaproteobacteria bacterium]|nr:trimethylamine methyltransferase family protein [Deltaproteobacteria bacterium]
METGFPERCLPRFSLLDKTQILKLHESALRILEEVGVRVLDSEGMTLLLDNGAKMI